MDQASRSAAGRVTRIERLLEHFRTQRPLRAGSLIISAYGDAIAPRGGTAWLGSLIRLLEPFGLNQRLVRTSVFRLARDGWLSATQIGRRSYYSLTESGSRRFANATRRIYAGPQQEWDRRWQFVLLSQVDNSRREALRKELAWQGYGGFAPGLMVHPMPDREALTALLEEYQALRQAVVFDAVGEESLPPGALKGLVRTVWKLDELASRYAGFLRRFRPVLHALDGVARLDPPQCMQTRLLLIHEYRRILLRDPQLPDELLPAGWAGHAAHVLCRNLYAQVLGPAERYLSEQIETPDGTLPPPAPYFYKRFGGLPA